MQEQTFKYMLLNSLNEELKVTSNKSDFEFSIADLDTPFVKNVIRTISEQTGKTPSELKRLIQQSIDETSAKMKGSEKTSVVAKQNLVESVLFDLIKTMNIEVPGSAFDKDVFTKLFNYILVRNKSFLKIKDPITKRRLKLSIIYTPQPSFIKQPDYVTRVDTAAASPEGDLIFNTDFVEQLSKYALLKGVVPKGSIYESNGGSIPDHYAYLEFLIMHEIYHIVHADHFYGVKKKGMTHLAQNYLGDYVTNYNLVKAGYEQIPIGLFSKDFNYDVYDTMDAMQDAMIEEMKLMSPEDKKRNKEQMDDHMDKDHNDTNEEQEQEPGDDQSGGEPGDDQSGGEPGDDQSGGDPGKGGDSDEESVNDKIEQAMKEADKEMAQSSDEIKDIDQAVEDMKNESEQESKELRDKRAKELDEKRKTQENNLKELEGNVKTPINWKLLIKKMFPKETTFKEESLARIHKRTRASMAVAKKGAPISIKAGEIDASKSSQSLMFLLDNSGSMSSVIDGISVELLKLIDKNLNLGVENMFVMIFDSTFDIYKVNLDIKGKKHTYQMLKNPSDLMTVPADKLELKSNKKPIKELFQTKWGAGTELPKALNKMIENLIKQQFNQVLFSDTDILYGDNLSTLKKLMVKGNKRPFSFNIILDSRSSYETANSKIGGMYKYMSYL